MPREEYTTTSKDIHEHREEVSFGTTPVWNGTYLYMTSFGAAAIAFSMLRLPTQHLHIAPHQFY
jgi:hypothetical protein